MGLDMGISVRRSCRGFERNYKWFEKFIETWEREYGYDVDICYWRKCYNIRDAIWGAIEKCHDNSESDTLDVNDIDTIVEILCAFNEENWSDGSGSIWEWEVIHPLLCKQTAALMELRELMVEDPEIEIYYYESY